VKNIPIQNIYFLLCYAWDKLDERGVVDVDSAGITDLINLFARVLVNGTNHLLKRGFDRGYILEREETRRFRGKLMFAPSLQRNLLRHGRAACEFDELNHNVLHNRIIKSTLVRLLSNDELDKTSRQHVRELCRRLHEIDAVEVTSKLFRNVTLHRNNLFYDFLLKICQFIHEHLLPSEGPGARYFRDFWRDEKAMRSLFEKFVRNFYRQNLPGYDVGRENIKWQWTSIDKQNDQWLPTMQTDVTLESGTEKIIVDCKYTASLFQEFYDTKKFQSEHLYQINAYLTQLPFSKKNFRAVLLYPAAAAAFAPADYLDSIGRRFSIHTLNLNQHWSKIHSDLLDLVG